MKIKGVVMEDFSNYKMPSMFIIFPTCDWKCDKECGERVCQNGSLAKAPIKDIDEGILIEKYLNNPISKAVVLGGLEPFDSLSDLLLFIEKFRVKSQDIIIIYTGYYKEEIADKIDILKRFKNIIIKFGRFIPGHEKHYDEVLGVELASPNQYAEVIS
jgi:hypothetical protein